MIGQIRWGRGAMAALLALSAGAAIAGEAAAQDNNTLRIGMYAKAPGRGNPYIGGGAPTNYWLDPVFDQLVRVNDKGQPNPWLAESWKLVDPTTWHLSLRKDAEFTSGVKVNADSIVASFAWALSEAGRATQGGAELRNVDSVTKVDEFTVAFKTKVPLPLLPGTTARAYIVDGKAVAEMGMPNYANNPSTTGGYRVVKWTDTEAEFVRFDKSWRAGKIPTLRFIETPEPASRLQAIVSKQIDLAVTVAPDNVDEIKRAGQTTHIFNSPNVMNYVMFTTDHRKSFGAKGTPFTDKRVRQAFNMAIDRKGIVEGLLQNVTKPANQPANPQTFGFNSDVKDYEFNPAKAKALLAEAGYPNGFEMIAGFIPGAIPRDIEIYTYMFADNLSKIGVKSEIRQLPFADWLRQYTSGNWVTDGSGFSAFVDPQMDAARPFVNFTCNTPNAIVCIKEMMPMIDAQQSEMDPVKREAMLKQIMQIWHDDAVTMPILYGIDIFAATPRLKNFQNWNRVLLWERMTLEGNG